MNEIDILLPTVVVRGRRDKSVGAETIATPSAAHFCRYESIEIVVGMT